MNPRAQRVNSLSIHMTLIIGGGKRWDREAGQWVMPFRTDHVLP